MQESKESIQVIDGQNKQMAMMRDKLEQMHARLRRMDNNIRASKIQNENLKIVQEFE